MKKLVFLLLLFSGMCVHAQNVNPRFESVRATNVISRSLIMGDSTFFFVSQLEDFPEPVDSVIYLDSISTYFLTRQIDLQGNRIQGTHDNAIFGTSPELCGLFSTGLHADTPLIRSSHTLALNKIRIEHATAIELDATGVPNQVIDWYGVNFVNCTSRIGTIKNYGNAIMLLMGFLNSGNLTFDGSIGTIALDNSIIDVPTGDTGVILPSTLTISRRFRITFSSLIATSGETGFYLDTSASIPNEGFIIHYCNFAGGGDYILGLDQKFRMARWDENRGIMNTTRFAGYYMIANATPTVIDSVGVYRKILGTTTEFEQNSRFIHSDNRLEYNGGITLGFKLTGVLTFTTSANNVIEVVVFKNGIEQENFEVFATANAGGRSENVPFQWFGDMSDGDYLEVYVANETGANNITITDLNVVVTEVK